MSIQHMRRRFAVQLKYVLWAIIAAFIVGLPLVFVPGGMFGGRNQEEQQKVAPADVVATIDGKPVTRAEVDRSFTRMVNQVLPFYASMGQSIGVGQLWRIRYDSLEQAIQNRLLVDEAQKQGISVSKGDLKKQAQQMVDQEIAQLKNQYKGPEIEQVFAQIVTKQGKEKPRETMSERDFTNWAMGRYLDPSSGLRDDLMVQQLRQSVTAQVSATEQDMLQSYDKATVRHIVITLHPTGKPALTDEQAKKRADDALAKIKGGADFAAVAKAESDDPEAKKSGGVLEVGRGRMAPEWDSAVFALKVGEVSAPIKVPWGYEIVRMDKITREMPKDFDKNKQQLMTSFTEQRRNEVWQKYVTDLRKKAKVSVQDPEMQAYEALMQGKSDEALAKLDAAKEQARNSGGLAAASVFYQIGQLLDQKKKWSDSADAYAEASDALSGEDAATLPGGRAEALMGMANAYEQLGQKEEAVMWYTAASEASETPGIHSQLLLTFQRLGKPDLVKKEQEWMANFEQQQRERQAQMEAQQKAAAAQAQGGAAPTAPQGQPQAQAQPAPVPQGKPEGQPAGAPQPR